MKKIILIIIALSLTACSDNNEATSNSQLTQNVSKQVSAAANVPSVSQQRQKTFLSYTPQQAMNLIKQRKDLIIVDVRSPQELRQGKIANSVLVPFMDVVRGKHNLPKNRPMLLVCAVGGRSYGAMQVLSRQGYNEIYNLKGGMDAWAKDRMPVVF